MRTPAILKSASRYLAAVRSITCGGSAGDGAQSEPGTGQPPVGEVVIDEYHGRQTRQPHAVAVVHDVHPAEEPWQLEPGHGSEPATAVHAAEIPAPADGKIHQRVDRHQRPHPDVLVGLRQPLAPDDEEHQMAHACEQTDAHQPQP